MAKPCYMDLDMAELRHRRDAALETLRSCRVCPRVCGVDRSSGSHSVETGRRPVCLIGRRAVVSSAFPHHGEEDCLRGKRGSGTIFFSGCNLKCVFCQNWDISQHVAGRVVDAEELAALMLGLQAQGCHNINFVTPEHVVPQVLEGLVVAIEKGLRLPLVYNTSAYDALESLNWLDGVVDLYMPDFKLWSPEAAKRYCKAPDYPEVARTAILEMHRQVGPLRLDAETGLATRGVLVRLLVMPGMVDDAAAILRFLHDVVSPETYVNIMGQYRPTHRVPGNLRYATINRRPRDVELDAVFDAARRAGLHRLDTRWLS